MDDKNIHCVIMRFKGKYMYCEFSVFTVRIFMKCTRVCADQTTYLFLIEPEFPCSADEIAEPRPDMNIKVAAFTLSEKSININKLINMLHVYRC